MSVYKAGKNRRLELDLSKIYKIKWDLRDYNTYLRRISRGRYFFIQKFDLGTSIKEEVQDIRKEQRSIIGRILGVLPMSSRCPGLFYKPRDCNLRPKTEFYWFNDVKQWYTDAEMDLADDGKIFLPEHPECPYDCRIPKRTFGFI